MTRHRSRSIAAVVMVIAGVLLVVPGVIAWWLHVHLLTTDGWVATVAPLIEEPAVLDAIADEATAAIVEVADLGGRLEPLLGTVEEPAATLLRELLAPLADQIEVALRTRIRSLLEEPEVAEAWVAANRRGHDVVLTVLRGESENLVIVGSELRVDLGAVIRTLEAGLVAEGYAFARLLPDDVDRQLTLLRTDALPQAQATVTLLERLRIVLPIVAGGFLLGAVAVAPQRLRTIQIAALGAGAGVLLAQAVLWWVPVALLPDLAADPARLAMTARSMAVLTRDLERALWLVAAVALVIVLVVLVRGHLPRGAQAHGPQAGADGEQAGTALEGGAPGR